MTRYKLITHTISSCYYSLPEHNPTVISSADTHQVILQQGQSLNEWCRAYSQGRPEIKWYLDGVRLHHGKGYTIRHVRITEGGQPGDEGTQSTIRLDKITVAETGEYRCVACNIGNCTSQVIRVYMNGKFRVRAGFGLVSSRLLLPWVFGLVECS